MALYDLIIVGPGGGACARLGPKTVCVKGKGAVTFRARAKEAPEGPGRLLMGL